MIQPATDLPLTPRQRLRWRRAMDTRLIDAIYGTVVRDHHPPTAPASVNKDRVSLETAMGR